MEKIKVKISDLKLEIISFDNILEKNSIPAKCLEIYNHTLIHSENPVKIGWHIEAGWFVLEYCSAITHLIYSEKDVEIES